MTEEKLQLFCLVFPDNHPNDVFLVEIDSNELVGVLRDIVKLEVSPWFNNINVTDLFLWKCSIPADDNLGATIDSIQFDQGDNRQVTYLNPTRKMSRYFGDDEEPEGTIRILVQVLNHDVKHLVVPPGSAQPSREEDNDMTELIEKLDKTVSKLLESDHKAGKSSGYITFQKQGEPIYDGRYPGPYVADQRIDTRAPPVQLYNRVFGQFLDGIANKNLDVPTEVIQATARLMNLASAIYQNEAQRRVTIQEELTKAISVAVGIASDSVTTSPDGTVTTEILIGNVFKPAAICIKKDKNEIGDGGSDPSIQAGLSYGQFWAQKDQAELRANSCCPTFLFATAGPSFAILGAIWTDKIVVHRLTDFIWIGNDTIFNEPSIYRIARILHAFAQSTRSLAAYYQSLDIQPHPIRGRFFPSINTYRNESDNSIVKFRIIKHLEPHSICITFLAVTEAPASNTIVVKFVHRYNAEAHRLLADRGMAPKLLYYGEVGSIRASDSSVDSTHRLGYLHMVVMDYVDGLRADIAHCNRSLPQNFLEQVQAILAQLHDHDYVFGDLRSPNIMVSTKNDKVMFIDFDWVGKDGESRYPIIMDESIDWPEGVKNGLGVMKKEHDIYMLKRLFKF